MYPNVSYDDVDFRKKVIAMIKRDGFVVVTDVFSDDQCDEHVSNIVGSFEQLGTGIDRANVEETWTRYNLPPQTRAGLFQALASNFPTVWQIRSNDKIRRIFQTMYTNFRGDSQDDFIVSGDGINAKPGIVGPYGKKKDWAHIDQTCYEDTYQCVQGQVVLTDTTACFVASPKSHLLYDDIRIRFNMAENKRNWFRLSDGQIDYVKKRLVKIGGQYQIPILAPKGSCIFWLSTTIHSARLQTECEDGPNDWDGWRCIVYVCYRPKSEFNTREINNRIKAYNENRTTNHWGKLFGKKPGSFHLYNDPRHPDIMEMIDNPILVYDRVDKPRLNNVQKRLIGRN